MKDFDINKEASRSNLDYNELWDEEEEENVKKEIKSFEKGKPRIGLKGRYIKKKGNVTKRQIKNSYYKYKFD